MSSGGRMKFLLVSSLTWHVISAPTGITICRGPTGKRKGRPAQSSESEGISTMSDSKRSSVNQVSTTGQVARTCSRLMLTPLLHDMVLKNKFRTFLIGRDSCCLISNTPFLECTASHIVPYSRPDVSWSVRSLASREQKLRCGFYHRSMRSC